MSADEMVPGIVAKYPALRAFLDRFQARPNIAAYMSSDRYLPAKPPIE